MEEQTRSYLMWSCRRKISSVPPPPPPLFMNSRPIPVVAAYHESWEEQAFAEDSSGLLGGSCVWPPRSYSCSFCRRKFRSAQALGGHMNVHRRDRARLKQSSSSPTASETAAHDQITTTSTQAECYNPNPNPNSGVDYTLVLSPSHSSSSPPMVHHQQILFHHNSSPPSSTDNFPAVRLLSTVPYLKLGMDNWKSKEPVLGSDMGKRGRREVEDVADDELVIDVVDSKRRRYDSVLPPISKPPAPEVLKLGSIPVLEELDLELRLGL